MEGRKMERDIELRRDLRGGEQEGNKWKEENEKRGGIEEGYERR